MEKAGQRLPISAGRKSTERASDSRVEINIELLWDHSPAATSSASPPNVIRWSVPSSRTRSTLYPPLPHCDPNLHGPQCLLSSSTWTPTPSAYERGCVGSSLVSKTVSFPSSVCCSFALSFQFFWLALVLVVTAISRVLSAVVYFWSLKLHTVIGKYVKWYIHTFEVLQGIEIILPNYTIFHTWILKFRLGKRSRGLDPLVWWNFVMYKVTELCYARSCFNFRQCGSWF